nr:MAG TPA: hypothetical protein [Caudoviricetes sp.]
MRKEVSRNERDRKKESNSLQVMEKTAASPILGTKRPHF